MPGIVTGSKLLSPGGAALRLISTRCGAEQHLVDEGRLLRAHPAVLPNTAVRVLPVLEAHRRLLRALFPRFHGTEVKTIGDAFLVEFQSALEAAQCGIEIQRTLAKRNHDVPADRRIEVKIGIHIGDVVHREGDVYGDGVNIASRIEPLAGAGGICISMDVERQIRSAIEVSLVKLAPMELFRVSVAVGEAGANQERVGAHPRGI